MSAETCFDPTTGECRNWYDSRCTICPRHGKPRLIDKLFPPHSECAAINRVDLRRKA